MQKQENDDTVPKLTKKMAERIIRDNMSRFIDNGLTPTGPIISNENPAILSQIIASTKRGK